MTQEKRQEKFVTVVEFAKFCGLARDRVYRLVAHAEGFPVITVGRRTLIARDSGMEWILAHRAAAEKVMNDIRSDR